MKKDGETAAEEAVNPVKVWRTPVVIVGALEEAEFGSSPGGDGTGGAS